MHFVYFLWSDKLKKVYIGETSNVLKRLNFHNKGLQRYTKKGTPWKLIGYVEFGDRSAALQEEKRLKNCRNKEYYKKYLIEHGKIAPGVSPDKVGI